jgi:SAM-dependent methyltransferase
MKWLKRIFQGLEALVQTRNSSFEKHNAQYEEEGKLDRERRCAQEMLEKKVYDEEANKISRLLARYPNRDLCVDIGSGNGWYSAYISQFFQKVEGIEPSAAAIRIAKTW